MRRLRRLEARAAGREDALAELIAYHFREAATLTNVSETAQLDAVEIRRKGGGLAEPRGRCRGGRCRDRRGRPTSARGHRAGGTRRSP